MLGAELEYFLVRMRDDGTIELADPLDTLDQPCYDMRGLTRNLDFVSMVAQEHHRARVGQLRDRPRGRERPVRAELRLRRRAHHLRPLDLLPLHGRVAGPGARHDRDVHAQAVLPPHRQRLPLPHEPLARRRERVRGGPGRRPARHGPVGDRVPVHRRAEGAREGLHRRDRPHRDSYKRLVVGTRSGSSWAPVYRELRLQQPHADAPHPGGRAASRTAPSTARATPTSARP